MLTKFSKWFIYFASYAPLYIILFIRILFTETTANVALMLNVKKNLKDNVYILIVLFILFILSCFVIGKIKRFEANERVYHKLSKNRTGEMASFFIPFILSLLTITIDWYGWIISVFIFILCGIVVIQSDWLHICPVFFYMGYKLYIDNSGQHVLSKLTKEQFNQILIDNVNGLEVKALTPNLFILKVNSFH